MRASSTALAGPSPTAKFRWRPVAAIAVAASATAWYFGGTGETEIAEPARVVSSGPRSPAAAEVAPASLAFARRSIVEATRDLFAQHTWYVPPPPLPVAAPGPPPPPMAPAFPYQYFGRYERSGEKSVFILTQGDRTYDVHVGDVLDNTWSIDAADGGSLQVTYLPLKQSQSLAIWSRQ